MDQNDNGMRFQIVTREEFKLLYTHLRNTNCDGCGKRRQLYRYDEQAICYECASRLMTGGL